MARSSLLMSSEEIDRATVLDSLAHGENDLATNVPGLQMPHGLGGCVQQVGLVRDGCEVASRHQLFLRKSRVWMGLP